MEKTLQFRVIQDMHHKRDQSLRSRLLSSVWYSESYRWALVCILGLTCMAAWFLSQDDGAVSGLSPPKLSDYQHLLSNKSGDGSYTNPDQAVIQELGPSAYASYKLDAFSSSSSSSQNDNSALQGYHHVLEQFLHRHFPPADSDLSDPDSLINAMRAYLVGPSLIASTHMKTPAPVPNTLFRTARTKSTGGLTQKQQSILASWNQQGLNITFHDDEQANEWVKSRFQQLNFCNEDDSASEAMGQEVVSISRGVRAAWEKLADPPILRSDLWRYLVLATDGGIYADTDVELLKPLREWGLSPSWNGASPPDYTEPSLIVGVEVDVANRTDWYGEYTHPLQIVQWTMASARGHPVLIDTIRRIVVDALREQESLETPSEECSLEEKGHAVDSFSRNPSHETRGRTDHQEQPVIFRTGPGPFTDAVFQYLLAKHGKVWTDFRKLPLDGWRSTPFYENSNKKNGDDVGHEHWGDIRLLQMTGFSPGVHEEMGSQSIDSPAAMVHHYFKGTWRHRRIALKVMTGFIILFCLGLIILPTLTKRLGWSDWRYRQHEASASFEYSAV